MSDQGKQIVCDMCGKRLNMSPMAPGWARCECDRRMSHDVQNPWHTIECPHCGKDNLNLWAVCFDRSDCLRLSFGDPDECEHRCYRWNHMLNEGEFTCEHCGKRIAAKLQVSYSFVNVTKVEQSKAEEKRVVDAVLKQFQDLGGGTTLSEFAAFLEKHATHHEQEAVHRKLGIANDA